MISRITNLSGQYVMRILQVALLATLFSPWLAESAVPAELATQQSPTVVRVDDGPANVAIWNVTDPKEIAIVTQSFQRQLTKLGSTARISSCDRVVAVSRIEQGAEILAGKGLSYGASCAVNIGNRQLSLLMCDFPMVGKFTVTGSGSSTIEWFANFIRTNCPAGG